MPIYKAPIRDLQFVYHELFKADKTLSSLAGYDEVGADLVDAILQEAAKICEQVLQPLNQPGDEQGCRFEKGQVFTPDGFKQAYQTFTQGGWGALSLDPDIGGQGLPETISFMLEEMLTSANASFSLYPVLTRSAINALNIYAPDELKKIYLPKMVEGTWSGTMCLTEAQAGSDLSLVKTKAQPEKDGSYTVTGTKIFITGGEHDLTENIIHMVLARLPDAPVGVRGISLFLVPKLIPDTDGEPADSNNVSCGSIEHKMGIKASSTCVINFDAARGYLVGPVNKGLACMFTMMNASRLSIGIQGLGLGEVAYQNAVAYAAERLQGRCTTDTQSPHQQADPLLVHPDIRRMLLTARAYNEGCRALSVWTAINLDISLHHPEKAKREQADDLVSLIIPVVKAFFTDCGFETSNLCLQVFGGHGYIRESGMEQFVRDARIAQIYEGTNGIQALDLVKRKLFIHQGRLPRRFFKLLNNYVAENNSESMSPFIQPLAESSKRLQELTKWLIDKGQHNPHELEAAANDYLRFFALTTMAYLWAQMANIAIQKRTGNDASFYRAKLNTARFFMGRLLPQTHSLEISIRSTASLMMDFDQQDF